jgi:hypothetical protein
VSAVASFFVASAVIPERDAVAPQKAGASKKSMPTMFSGGKAAIAMVGVTSAENPAAAPEARPVPLDLIPPTHAMPMPVPVAKTTPTIALSAPPNTRAALISMEAAPVNTQIAVDNAAAAPDTAAKKKKPDTPPPGFKIVSTAVCSSVENRAPAGISDKFSKESDAVYYFTHITGALDSAAILHRWYHEGKLIQTSILQIKSPNWRTHSKRNLATIDEPAGGWRVEIVDQKSGKVLEMASFKVE